MSTVSDRGSAPAPRLHEQMNLLLSRLGEAERRHITAGAASRFGRGGAVPVGQITGLDDKTIRRGREDEAGSLPDAPINRR